MRIWDDVCILRNARFILFLCNRNVLKHLSKIKSNSFVKHDGVDLYNNMWNSSYGGSEHGKIMFPDYYNEQSEYYFYDFFCFICKTRFIVSYLLFYYRTTFKNIHTIEVIFICYSFNCFWELSKYFKNSNHN